jgi:predicted nucleic acid-binding protein
VTVLLDSFAVLALLKGEPAAPQVHALVESEDAELTCLGVAEIVDHLVRIVGVTEEDAALDLAQLGLIGPQPLDPGVALRAGHLRARHYHRRTCAVSLADCVVASAAQLQGAPVATADPHLLDVCAREHIAVVPLPDSNGETWSAVG